MLISQKIHCVFNKYLLVACILFRQVINVHYENHMKKS
jgi:hypothetical protein